MKAYILLKLKSLIIWLYRNKRNEILYVLNNKTYDGKVTIGGILEVIELYKTSGLISTPDSEEKEEVFTAGNITTPEANTSKELVMYDQSSWSCVIYAICRAFSYNTGLKLTTNEVEDVKKYADQKGLWKDNEGMTFKDGCDALRGWLKENKNIDMYYIRALRKSNDWDLYRNQLGYMGMIGGYITDKYIADFTTDGVIDSTYTWDEKKKYGHAFTDYNSNKNEIDNYPTKFKANNQRVNEKQSLFQANGYYFSYQYFPLVSEKIEVKKTDYDKFLERGFIENPNPDRVMTERLYGTFRERELREMSL